MLVCKRSPPWQSSTDALPPGEQGCCPKPCRSSLLMCRSAQTLGSARLRAYAGLMITTIHQHAQRTAHASNLSRIVGSETLGVGSRSAFNLTRASIAFSERVYHCDRLKRDEANVTEYGPHIFTGSREVRSECSQSPAAAKMINLRCTYGAPRTRVLNGAVWLRDERDEDFHSVNGANAYAHR